MTYHVQKTCSCEVFSVPMPYNQIGSSFVPIHHCLSTVFSSNTYFLSYFIIYYYFLSFLFCLFVCCFIYLFILLFYTRRLLTDLLTYDWREAGIFLVIAYVLIIRYFNTSNKVTEKDVYQMKTSESKLIC